MNKFIIAGLTILSGYLGYRALYWEKATYEAEQEMLILSSILDSINKNIGDLLDTDPQLHNKIMKVLELEGPEDVVEDV